MCWPARCRSVACRPGVFLSNRAHPMRSDRICGLAQPGDLVVFLPGHSDRPTSGRGWFPAIFPAVGSALRDDRGYAGEARVQARR